MLAVHLFPFYAVLASAAGWSFFPFLTRVNGDAIMQTLAKGRLTSFCMSVFPKSNGHGHSTGLVREGRRGEARGSANSCAIHTILRCAEIQERQGATPFFPTTTSTTPTSPTSHSAPSRIWAHNPMFRLTQRPTQSSTWSSPHTPVICLSCISPRLPFVRSCNLRFGS